MNSFGFSEAAFNLIIKKLSEHAEVRKAAIFGSRAIGNFQHGSDVDIALYGKGMSAGLAMEISAELNERTKLPYMFDVLDYNSIDNAELKRHIDAFGKIIFERD